MKNYFEKEMKQMNEELTEGKKIKESEFEFFIEKINEQGN